MLKPSQQAVFRPLVDRAWQAQCQVTGCPVTDKLSRQAWYQDVLKSSVGVASTKDADDRVYPVLIRTFTSLAKALPDPVQVLSIDGWSPAQNAVIRRLADAAYKKDLSRHDLSKTPLKDWFTIAAKNFGVFKLGDRENAMGFTHTAPDHTTSFDKVAELLAIVANDETWMRRTSEGSERRLRWLISQRLEWLTVLENRPVTWDYVWGCYDQARMLPKDLADATAESLYKVFQMLDTHCRRIKKQRRKTVAAKVQPQRDPVAAPAEEPLPF